MKPGIYENLSNEDYHASAGVSKSGLDLVEKCPAAYKARYMDGVKQEPTKAMLDGAMIHMATLEPKVFDGQYIIKPEGIDRRTKKGKAAWEDFLTISAGKLIISQADHDLAKAVSKAVHAHPSARNILTKGKAEQSVFHEDKSTGKLVKCRPDWWVEDVLADLKTTTDASPGAFSKACYNFRYHVQAAMYKEIVTAQTGIKINSFVFIVVEKSEPYSVAVYYADKDMLDLGAEEYHGNLSLYSRCKDEGIWPGYGAGRILPISLPRWAFK